MLNKLIKAAAHRSAAKIWSFFKRTDLAIREYVSAIDIHPDDAESWRCLGFLYAQQNNHALAIAAFKTSLQLLPQDNDTRFNLGFVLHETGETSSAIEVFLEVIGHNPNHDRAWYGMGLCLARTGELEQAIVAMKKASTLQYFNPYAGQKLAELLMQAGKVAEAEEEYLRVLAFDPVIAAQIKGAMTKSCSAK